jgi:hypothetical protein
LSTDNNSDYKDAFRYNRQDEASRAAAVECSPTYRREEFDMAAKPIAPGKRRLLTRRQAVEYLRERGFPITVGMLARYASNGTGPRYSRFSKFSLHEAKDLDAWASKMLARASAKSAELLGRERTA